MFNLVGSCVVLNKFQDHPLSSTGRSRQKLAFLFYPGSNAGAILFSKSLKTLKEILLPVINLI